ncbi:MAG: sigma-70 family RNA polymerase sigma factor [Verrucomicrobiales bacterium]|nr:sigma-70 family RNA polymerase sigma factor [Verrucomicrobiales bacterium]
MGQFSIPVTTEALPVADGDGSDVRALTERMVRGDEDAWREFHNRYFDRLWRYQIVVTRGQEEAAREAVQITFVRAARHIRRFETEAALWSWLTVLARSAVIDEQRKRSRYRAFLDRFLGSSQGQTGPPPRDADGLLLELLNSGLDELPPAERELLEQKYLAGASVREMAAERGDTEKAVESRLGRGRRKLKTWILERLHHED